MAMEDTRAIPNIMDSGVCLKINVTSLQYLTMVVMDFVVSTAKVFGRLMPEVSWVLHILLLVFKHCIM